MLEGKSGEKRLHEGLRLFFKFLYACLLCIILILIRLVPFLISHCDGGVHLGTKRCYYVGLSSSCERASISIPGIACKLG